MTPKSEPKILDWDAVYPAASSAFYVWTHGRDLEWAEIAWSHLTTAGLTAYRSEIGRCKVAIRLLALAQFYLDWCQEADDQRQEDDLMTWASDLEVSTFRIGQLLGDQEYVSGEDDEELCLSALQTLTEAERDTVRDALLTGFGGIDGLFLSLWRINHPAPVPKPPKPEKPVKEKPSTSPTETLSLFSTEDEENEEDDEEEDEEDDVFAEDDWAVLNSPSPEKMAAHEWLTDGCYSVR